MTTEAIPLYSPVFTLDIQIRKHRGRAYSITIKNKDQYTSIVEVLKKIEVLTKYNIFAALSIPFHNKQGVPVGPVGPAAVLMVLPSSWPYFSPPMFRFNRDDELVIIVSNRIIKNNIHHTIPSGSFINTSLVFSNTQYFYNFYNPTTSPPLCP